jgi:hypothetical protein
MNGNVAVIIERAPQPSFSGSVVLGPSMGGSDEIPSHGGVARSDSGRGAPGWVGFSLMKTPLKSPLVQGGTLFSSNVAPRGMDGAREKKLCYGA